MIAKLQRFLIVLGLMTSAAWALMCTTTGRPQHAADLFAVAVAGYACVFSAEFLLMRRVGRKDGLTPPVGWRSIMRAGLGELRYAAATFLWHQPFHAARWPDLRAGTRRDLPGVLLVHGYFCNRGFWNGWMQRLSANNTPFVAVTLEPVFGSIATYAPALEAAVKRLEQATGQPPVIVAHSMGGLAVRHWWAACATSQPGASAPRVKRLITLGTPHQGTWLARFAFSVNAREMRMHSAWLADLARREPPAHRARMTCYYSPCDNIVFPARLATLDEADNRLLMDVAHVGLAAREEPYAELLRQLHDQPARNAKP